MSLIKPKEKQHQVTTLPKCLFIKALVTKHTRKLYRLAEALDIQSWEDLGTANLRTRQCPQWYMAKNAVWLRCKLWKHKKSKSRLPYFPELSVHSLWTTALSTTEWKATYLKNFSKTCFKHIWQTSFRARELRSIICSGTKPQRPAVRTTKALGGKFQLH